MYLSRLHISKFRVFDDILFQEWYKYIFRENNSGEKLYDIDTFVYVSDAVA